MNIQSEITRDSRQCVSVAVRNRRVSPLEIKASYLEVGGHVSGLHDVAKSEGRGSRAACVARDFVVVEEQRWRAFDGHGLI